MAYFKTTIEAGETIEVIKSFTKRKGAKSRGGKVKATPEEIKEINKLNSERKLRLKINANFGTDDLWIMLPYKKDERPTPEEAKAILDKFIRELRKVYKKLGVELKYIHCTEYKRKAIHHHILINQPEGINGAKIVRQLWGYGRPYFKLLDETGQYKKIAAYIIKETEETFRENDGGRKQRYSCSRNLIIPKPETKVVKATRWMPDPRPKAGYYIDQETVYNGEDRFTGRIYQSYTMVRMQDKNERRRGLVP